MLILYIIVSIPEQVVRIVTHFFNDHKLIMLSTQSIFHHLIKKLDSSINEIVSVEASKEMYVLREKLIVFNTPQTKWMIK